MYAPPPPVAVATQRRNIWPLAGICCLGLVLFLIASTIILALIPVYLPHKQVNINNNNKDNNNLFYVQYNSVGNGNTSLTGTMNNSQNLAQIEQHINQGMVSSNEGVSIINGSSQTTFFRRRRNLLFRRMKRNVKTEVVFTCQYKFKQDCISDSCQTSAKTRINNAIAKMNTLSNIPVNIVNREFGNRSVPLTLTFVRILTQKPDNLGIEPSTLGQFTAVQSGQFTDSSTWTDGIVPYGQCNIIIPPNIQVTLAKSLVDLNIRRCDINGTLVLGSSVNQSVDFVYPVNLIVYPYGTLQDNTEGHVFNLPEGSIITVYPNGTFNGDGTVVNTATKSSSQSRKKRGILFPSGAGPRTCGILPGGQTQIFNKVTHIVAASADFTLGSTWLGGVAPTAAGCVLADGCGLSISNGYSLATTGLSGQLNMNFNYISISASATFRLGTSNSAAGFKFRFRLRLDCYGILADVTGGVGGIYLPFGSAFNFFAGGSFSSLVATSLKVYDTASDAVTTTFTLSASFSGPLYITISLTGSITTNTQTPGDAGSAATTISSTPSTSSQSGISSTISGTATATQPGGSTTTGGSGAAETTIGGQTSETTATTTPVPTLMYNATKSGSFNDSTIWSSGQVPSGKCSIVIPSGIAVTFSGTIFTIQVQSLTVAGTFIISSTTSFTFQYAISIVVHGSGKLQDQTSTHKWYFLAGSLCTFYPGASFTGSGTIVSTYTSLPASSSVVATYTFGSSFSGPFTFAILLSGQIQTYTSVTFIVAASGDFNVAATWLGGIIPTASLCSLVGGCGLYIPSGFSLSTASLNGELNIDFSYITVASGATFALGTSGLSIGFRFLFSFGLDIYGSLSFSASGGGIYLPFGSAFNFFAGAHFANGAAVEIRTYDVSVGGIGTLIVSLDSSFTGTLYVSVSTDGQQTQTSGAATPILPTTTSSSSITSFTASSTGSFNDSSIWVGGRVPSGNCSITIPSGITVILSGEILNIQVQTLTVAGAFIVSSTAGFTFQYAISIIVHGSGKLQDQTSTHKWYFLAGSLCTFYPGASFTGSGTIVSTYTSLPATGSIIFSYTFGYGFSGPFTFAVLVSGQIETFANVQFIVAASGDFSDASTWFGGIVPTASLCSLVGGCGLYIPSGFTLSTASLNGELNIDFSYITVASGATFDLATGGGIYLPFGCAFNFFAGGRFTNSAAVEIRTYDVALGGIGTLIVSLDSTFSSSLYVSISTGGQQTQTSGAATPILPTTTSSSSIASFTASRTGSFNDSSIWLGAQVPSGNCSITIPSGITVILSGEILNIQVQTLTVAGAFIVSSTAGFTFQYTISIIVQSGGKLQDQTSTHKWYFLAGSLCTFYPGASFIGSGTIVSTYTSLPASGSIISSYTFGYGFSGPFTFAVLVSGQIETFANVQFIVAASGDFNNASTWFGGIVPTASLCSLVGGCGLYIPSGFSLSTASLYGELNIDFSYITVASGATFDLGTSGLPMGFRFLFSFGFDIYGSLSFSATGGGIYLPFGCAFNFFAGGRFTNSAAVEIRTYDVALGGIGNLIVSLDSSFTGTLYVSVSTDGQHTQTSGAATPILPTTTSSSSIASFTASRTGSFSDSTLWAGGQVPSGNCSITIPSGMAVTFSGEILNIPVQTLYIAGTFIISSTANFTFQYAINIVIESEGKLQDQSADNNWYFLAGSSCTFYPGASFTGSGTVVYTYKSLPASGSAGGNYRFGSSFSGPFTFVVLLSGQIETFTNVQFIVAASVGGCGLYIPSGFSLSTASLNGELNIDFSYITVASGATFDLGTSGLSMGFRFLFSFGFDIYGSLSFSATGGGIYLPFGSAFNFFAGGHFANSAAVEIRTYDVSVGGIGSLIVSLDSSFTGTLYVSVSTDGQQTQTSDVATPILPTTTSSSSITYFSATQSGNFTDSTTWSGGQVPSGNCSITIPSDVTVIFSGEILNIQVQTLTVAGALMISSTAGFTFQYAISMVIQGSGKLQDQTSNHKWYFLGGSLCTFHPGASFIGSGTIVYTYTSLPASGSANTSYTLGSSFSGPFTFAVVASGQIETFANVQFIVAASGDFSDASTWFGGIVPTASLCSLVGGCGLYIPSGFSLTTASLNGELNIDFSYITVASGATFDLGTSGLSIGFRFLFIFGFDIYGSLSFSATGGGIFLPFGSAFNFFAGARFRNSAAVEIRTYDVSVGGIGTLVVSLDSTFSSSLYVSISIDGQQTQTSEPATPVASATTNVMSTEYFTGTSDGVVPNGFVG